MSAAINRFEKRMSNIEQGISNVEGKTGAVIPSTFEIPCSILVIWILWLPKRKDRRHARFTLAAASLCGKGTALSSRSMMSSVVTPSASALKVVTIRCRNTG
jgi:hypothetical protein